MRRITLQRPFRFYSCNILITCRQGHKAGDNTAFDTLNVFCRGATGALSGLEKKQYKPVERFPQARASEAPPGDYSTLCGPKHS